MIENLFLGFETATTVKNLLFCFFGVTLGTVVGVIPALGALATISLLLPLTYLIIDPITSIIFLAGIYYGCQYGGSITSIMLRMPGEVSSVVTCEDGNALAKKGHAGTALTITTLSSFVGGILSAAAMAGLAFYLSKLAFVFGPADYASLMVLGLLACLITSTGSFYKGLIMIFLGIFLGTVGTDLATGKTRLTGGISSLRDGIPVAALAIGLFGLGEMLYNLYKVKNIWRKNYLPLVKSLYPSSVDFKKAFKPSVRGASFGTILGLLPGGGPVISSFLSYAFEKFISKNPKKFGKGSIPGIAGPEAANNAASQTCLLPTLILGLPITPVVAVMAASLIMNGIQPGPDLMTKNPDLFWGVIASFLIGNLMLVILNIPLVRVWIKILHTPTWMLYLLVVSASLFGVYSLRNNTFDLLLLLFFGCLGFYLKLKDFPVTVLVMSFVIGPLLEEYYKRALTISAGDYLVFLNRPISCGFLIIALLCVWYKMRSKNSTIK